MLHILHFVQNERLTEVTKLLMSLLLIHILSFISGKRLTRFMKLIASKICQTSILCPKWETHQTQRVVYVTTPDTHSQFYFQQETHKVHQVDNKQNMLNILHFSQMRDSPKSQSCWCSFSWYTFSVLLLATDSQGSSSW